METVMNDAVSKIAILQALGQLGQVEREANNKIITLLALNSTEPLDPEQKKLGAEPGAFVFRGSAQVYRKTFIALPLFEHIMFVEWPPEREKAAPLDHHFHKPVEATPADKGEWRMPNGNRIVRTRYLHLALVNDKGQVDFNDRWALALASTGLRFFDQEFASQYPMEITVDGLGTKGPIASCKWKFSSELHNDGRNSWIRVKYTKGSPYGSSAGTPPTWDELLRGAEIEAEMKSADAIGRGQAPEQIGATPPKGNSPLQGGAYIEAKAEATPAQRAKITITSGRAAYDPQYNPPAPPAIDAKARDGPGDPASAEFDDVTF
jgi:hypothetical protein